MFTLLVMLIGPFEIMAFFSSLAALYVVCLIVGGGLLVISTVFGGDADTGLDVDADVDFDMDVDADFDGGMEGAAELGDAADVSHPESSGGSLSLSSWLSIHFVVYFVAVFGLVGTVLTYLSDLGPTGVLLAALACGIALGQGVHQLLRLLRRTSGNSTTSVRDYVNRAARVTVAITPAGKGEVAVPVRGGTRFLPAVARRENDGFERGAQVVVTAFRNGTAEVVSREEYEFKTDSKPE